jgi:hypothetical protein
VRCTLAAKGTKFLQFQAFRVLFFVFGAVVINSIALGALKLDCLAHIYLFLALPRRMTVTTDGVTEDFDLCYEGRNLNFLRSPRAGLNRWPRPYQGRALPTELQGQLARRLQQSTHHSGVNYESQSISAEKNNVKDIFYISLKKRLFPTFNTPARAGQFSSSTVWPSCVTAFSLTSRRASFLDPATFDAVKISMIF